MKPGSANVVLTSRQRQTLTVSLNRPERLNAINRQLLSQLYEALVQANSDPQIRAVVLRGEGRAFCSGDDTREFQEREIHEEDIRTMVRQYQDVSRQILFSDKIFIAAVQGWAVGGGLELAIGCDVTVFADDTQCFFPEVSMGLFVTGGVTALLPDLVGRQKALRLMLFGEKFGADEAVKWGLAEMSVSSDELNMRVASLAQQIESLPVEQVAALKRAVSLGERARLDQALRVEAEETERAFMAADMTAAPIRRV